MSCAYRSGREGGSVERDEEKKLWWFNLRSSLKDEHLSPWQQGERVASVCLQQGSLPTSQGPCDFWTDIIWMDEEEEEREEPQTGLGRRSETRITQSLLRKCCSRDHDTDSPRAVPLPKLPLEAGIINSINYQEYSHGGQLTTVQFPSPAITGLSESKSARNQFTCTHAHRHTDTHTHTPRHVCTHALQISHF